MKRWLYLALAVLCLIPAFGLAAYGEADKFVKWHLRDLYYYDAQGTMVQLELAPKLLVRFENDIEKEKRSQILSEFSPVAEKYDPTDFSVMVIEFGSSFKPYKILEALNKISSSGLAEVRPVFFIENIEAVIEGMVVEPKTTLTSERLLERMKSYGDFSVRQSFAENGTWVYLVERVKPPLNILVLINLLAKDSWVKRVYPRFRFLHDPIMAYINVAPVSGTVGEVRTVTFTIKIFDPEIKLLEDQLPRFGDGLFRPIQGTPASPSTVKYPPGYLFEVLEGPVRYPVKTEKRSRIYVTSWRFKHHALGEWTIHPQPVSFSKGGVTQEVRSSGFTFVVNSQIGSLKIDDMPFPYPLIYPQEKPVSAPEIALPPIPSYWFDRWLANPEAVRQYTFSAGVFLGMSAVLTLYVLFLLAGVRGKQKSVHLQERIRRLEMMFEEARAAGAYERYENALSAILTDLFPHVGLRPTWEKMKDDDFVRRALGSEAMEKLERTFYELGRRYSKNFTSAPESLAELDKSIREILDAARTWLISRRGAV